MDFGTGSEIGKDARARCPRAVRRKLRFVTGAQFVVLHFLGEQAIADGEHLDAGPHEAAKGVFGRRDDRLSAHVERRIDENRAARQRLELREQCVIPRVGVAMDSLHACRVIDVRHRGDRGARDIEAVDPEQRVLRGGHGDAPLRDNVRDEQHVRAVDIEVEPFREVLLRTLGERAEGLAIFHAQVEFRIVGDRGSPVSSARRARGPNSMRPWCHPSALPSASARAQASINASSPSTS
jgi:hypothetical protein